MMNEGASTLFVKNLIKQNGKRIPLGHNNPIPKPSNYNYKLKLALGGGTDKFWFVIGCCVQCITFPNWWILAMTAGVKLLCLANEIVLLWH